MANQAQADLYERDFYAWTQDQAARLRALAGDNRFDVAHVAAEIADLGASQRSALASHLRQALHHLLLLASRRAEEPCHKWLDEVDLHCDEMRSLLAQSPSLSRKIDVDDVWRNAVRSTSRKLARYGEGTLRAEATCPLAIPELTDEGRELAQLQAVVADAITVEADERGSS